MRSFTDWMSAVSSAAMRNCVQEDGLYYGAEGAKRLARECGSALLDFPDGEKNISSTYSGICVRVYDLRPPIDAGTWNDELRKGMERARHA